MATIRLLRKHSFDREEVLHRLEQPIHAAGQEFGLRLKWEGYVCYFDGPARGRIEIREHTILVDAKLGLSASFLKSKIVRRMKQVMDRSLTAASS